MIQAAQSIQEAKSTIAHSYISVKAEVDKILTLFPDQPFEHFIRLAVLKSCKKILGFEADFKNHDGVNAV